MSAWVRSSGATCRSREAFAHPFHQFRRRLENTWRPARTIFFIDTRSGAVTSLMARLVTPATHTIAAAAGVIVALLCGCQGAHLQAGPSIGYAFERGTTVGWEAGAGTLGVVRVSAGGTYRLEPPEPREPPASEAQNPSPDHIHYLALEPLGVSLGITFPSVGKPGFLGGVWAGWMFDPNPNGLFGNDPDGDQPFTPDIDCPSSDALERGLLLSGAIGLRYMGGEWEAYFTPKAVLAYCVEFGS